MNQPLFSLFVIFLFLFFILFVVTAYLTAVLFRASSRIGNTIRVATFIFCIFRILDVIFELECTYEENYTGFYYSVATYFQTLAIAPYFIIIFQVIFQWISIFLLSRNLVSRGQRRFQIINYILCGAMIVFALLATITTILQQQLDPGIITIVSAIYFAIYIGTYIGIVVAFCVFGAKIKEILKASPARNDMEAAKKQMTIVTIVGFVCWTIRIAGILWIIALYYAPSDPILFLAQKIATAYLPEIVSCAFIHKLYHSAAMHVQKGNSTDKHLSSNNGGSIDTKINTSDSVV